MNGYVIAFLIDGTIQTILFKNNYNYRISGIHLTKKGSTLIATLFSIAVVIAYELMPSTSTTSDILDILAGISGALLYLLVRWFALRVAAKSE